MKKRVDSYKNSDKNRHLSDLVYTPDDETRFNTKGFGTKRPRNKAALDAYEERQRREKEDDYL